MDIQASCAVLNGAPGDGHVSTSSSGTVIGLFLKSALTGSLTINGLSQSSGAAQSWVVAPATSGYVAAPGSAKFWSLLSYTLSNAGADAGKAVLCFAPT